jgi:anti-sigma regulatory factor (Ser/Thr protein kinase)
VLSGSQVDSDVAQLLVSELVTNAVRHAGGDGVLVRATLQADLLRVEVHDSSPSVPGPVSPAPESAEGGRGLLLVDALADRWGVEQVTAGKRTWFELGPER